MRTLVPAAFVALAALISLPAAAASLVPPKGYLAPASAAKSGKYDCPSKPEPYTDALDFPSKYEGSGKSRDSLNEEADAEYKEKTQPVRDFEKGIPKLVGAAMDGKGNALQCAIDWYTAWAEAGALLGAAPNHTGRSVRKWALASIASSYVRLKFSSSKPLAPYAEQQKKIEGWLGQIADKVVAEWDPNERVDKLNNHYYWSAWAAMAAAVALDRRDLFDWSLKIYDRFTTQVDADGYLPNELKRKTRALSYHLFAIAPLSMIAAFAEANGVDVASKGNNALKRLGERTLQGFDDPKMFESKAGAKQVLEGLDEPRSKLAWLEPYCAAVDQIREQGIKYQGVHTVARGKAVEQLVDERCCIRPGAGHDGFK